MADLNDLLDEPVEEEGHEFEVDLNCLVIINHDLTLKAIDSSEDEELANLPDEGLEYEVTSSMQSDVSHFHEELRRAANNLAIVGLVTRLDHWISKYMCDPALSDAPEPSEMSLVRKLEFLNKRLGRGPEPIPFFGALVDVRDSVIHGDSKAEWNFPPTRRRQIKPEYTHLGDYVELSQEQLKEAVAKAVRQVKWYDEKLQKKRERAPADENSRSIKSDSA